MLLTVTDGKVPSSYEPSIPEHLDLTLLHEAVDHTPPFLRLMR